MAEARYSIVLSMVKSTLYILYMVYQETFPFYWMTELHRVVDELLGMCNKGKLWVSVSKSLVMVHMITKKNVTDHASPT